jgi:hypothetical protein
MKKTITLLIALASCGTYVFSQSISPQVVASNGMFAVAPSGYSLSYTTGQGASATLNPGTSIITQGFQQPNDVYTGLQTFVTPTLTVQLYPNPASDHINLVINSTNNAGTYTVQLVDLLGRVLQQPLTTQVASGQTRFVFNVQQLPSSMYFITIKSSGSDVIHSFKFSKIN